MMFLQCGLARRTACAQQYFAQLSRMETTCRVGCFTAAHAQYSLPNELECRPCATLSYAGSVSAVSLALFYSSSSRAQRGLPSELKQKPCATSPFDSSSCSAVVRTAISNIMACMFLFCFIFKLKFQDCYSKFECINFSFSVSSLKSWILKLVYDIMCSPPKGSRPSNFDGGRKDAATNEKQAFYTQACDEHLWKQACFLFVSSLFQSFQYFHFSFPLRL